MASLVAAERYVFESIGEDQGLRDLSVTSLCQDRQGFLWVGTPSGLFRYDGHRLLGFSTRDGLPDVWITALHEGPDGTLWVGTYHGLAWWSGARFAASANEDLRQFIYPQGIASGTNGQVLVATRKGLAAISLAPGAKDVRFELLRQPAALEGLFVTSILPESEGAVWFGCRTSICFSDGKSLRVWGEDAGVPSDFWRFILRDRAGNLWARSAGRLLELPPGANRFQTVSMSDVGPLNFGVPSLAFDRNGTLMVPTSTGLAMLRGGKWTRVSHRQGLPSGTVTAFLDDRNGLVWVGTLAGLVRWAGYGQAESYTELEGLAGEGVLALLEDSGGGMWAGTDGGLSHGVFTGGNWQWRREGEPGLQWVSNLAQAKDGAIWLASVEPQAVRYLPKTGKTERYGQFDDAPYDLFIDSADRVWVTTSHGLYRGNAGNPAAGFERVLPAGATTRTTFTWAEEDSRADLWFGSFSGLFRLAGDRWFHYQRKDGLSSDRIGVLAPSPNGEILASNWDVAAIDHIRADGERLHVASQDLSADLYDNKASTVRYDRAGRLWVLTAHGAAMRFGNAWVHMDQPEGLIASTCNAIVAAADGSVWVGTPRGLSHFRVPTLPAAERAPAVTFAEVLLGGRPVDSRAPLVETSSQSFLARLTTLDFVRAAGIQYRYRGLGGDARWVELDRPEIISEYPRPGHYRVEVQARRPFSAWGPVTALAFEVTARWYESFAFKAGLVLLLACAALGAWRLRASRFAAAQAHLEQVIGERTRELTEANAQLRNEITERELGRREKQRLENELVQAKRMESIGRLAGGVAHDFNNLLTVINGHCDLLLADLRDGDPARAAVMEVRAAGQRAAELTERLLAFSRKQVQQLRPVSLAEVVTSLQDMLRRLLGEDIELVTDVSAASGMVMADRGQIEQVLINLVVNARDAIAGPGTITIGVRPVEIGQSGGPPDTPPGRYVEIAVADTGHGMDAATLANIFEPFFTTKDVGKGTGLGLSMVHGVVKQSGGSIVAESEPGKGTVLRIYLPQSAGEPEVAPTPAPVRLGPTGNESILVVEDQDAVRRLAALVLREAGYTVTESSNGAAALSALRTSLSPPDLLVTDVVMPGVSGSELAKQVLARFPSTAVLYVSGYPRDNAELGDVAVDYLSKPFTARQLLRKVRSVLDRRR
jgi:signal transduction histidine kinase/CheY-like chemotaxis protein/streptogramin lyase